MREPRIECGHILLRIQDEKNFCVCTCNCADVCACIHVIAIAYCHACLAGDSAIFFFFPGVQIYKNGRLELYQGNSYECSPRNESIAKRDIIGDYHFFTIKTLFHPTILSTSAGTVHYYVSKDPVLINKTKNSILKLGHVNFHPEEILIVSYNNISSKRNITKVRRLMI